MLVDGCVGPVVPRRDTNLAAQLVDAEDGTATVAAHNRELVLPGIKDVLLGLAIQFLLVLLQCVGYSGHDAGILLMINECHLSSADTLYVCL